MNHELEHLRRINPNLLSGEFYFPTLLEEALAAGIFHPEDAERIQFDCLRLLAERVELYTRGMSSSIRTEAAQQLMASNLFTIGLALKTFPSPDRAADALWEESIPHLFEQGRKRIDIKLRSVRQLHNFAVKRLPNIENETFHSTVDEGISGFLKLYNPDFGAHLAHITMDYPLCNPIADLAGIELIQRYLECILLEEEFLSHFPAEPVHYLLCGYDPAYEQGIFNLLRPVLAGALGCVLTGLSPTGLNLSPAQLPALRGIFTGRSREECEAILERACHTLIAALEIQNSSLRKYLFTALPEITAEVFHAAKTDTFPLAFPLPDYRRSR